VPFPLADLEVRRPALVAGLSEVAGMGNELAGADGNGNGGSATLLARLRDLGFVAGARCEVIARMWLGGDPLVVRIGGCTFALRREEAAAVHVISPA
jgi:Fe2+ transport system protein FeoA